MLSIIYWHITGCMILLCCECYDNLELVRFWSELNCVLIVDSIYVLSMQKACGPIVKTFQTRWLQKQPTANFWHWVGPASKGPYYMSNVKPSCSTSYSIIWAVQSELLPQHYLLFRITWLYLTQQEMPSKTDAVCASICHDNGRINGNVCLQIHRPLRP